MRPRLRPKEGGAALCKSRGHCTGKNRGAGTRRRARPKERGAASHTITRLTKTAGAAAANGALQKPRAHSARGVHTFTAVRGDTRSFLVVVTLAAAAAAFLVIGIQRGRLVGVVVLFHHAAEFFKHLV